MRVRYWLVFMQRHAESSIWRGDALRRLERFQRRWIDLARAPTCQNKGHRVSRVQNFPETHDRAST